MAYTSSWLNKLDIFCGIFSDIFFRASFNAWLDQQVPFWGMADTSTWLIKLVNFWRMAEAAELVCAQERRYSYPGDRLSRYDAKFNRHADAAGD
jgi:hypothetical protein